MSRVHCVFNFVFEHVFLDLHKWTTRCAGREGRECLNSLLFFRTHLLTLNHPNLLSITEAVSQLNRFSLKFNVQTTTNWIRKKLPLVHLMYSYFIVIISSIFEIFLLLLHRVNCSFYFKIGACRHGDRCSRLHNKPTFSQVRDPVLLLHLKMNFNSLFLRWWTKCPKLHSYWIHTDNIYLISFYYNSII